MLGLRVVEFGRSDVERDADVLAELVARVLDRRGDRVERVFNGVQARGETAFVADRRVESAFFEHAFERMERFRTHLNCLTEALRADRHNHEFLEINRSVGVRAAVDDVHHRNREHLRVRAAEVFVKRQSTGFRRRFRNREGNAENRIRAELGLRFRPVELEHRLVDGDLVKRVETDEFRRNQRVDVVNRFEHALPAETFLGIDTLGELLRGNARVAEFERFIDARGSSRGNRRAPHSAGFKRDVHFNRGIAARIDNFATFNVNDAIICVFHICSCVMNVV